MLADIVIKLFKSLNGKKMRAKEFLKEYAVKVDGGKPGGGLNPQNDMAPPADINLDNIDKAIEDMLYRLRKGEARDMNHAISMCSNDMACQLECSPTEFANRIKQRLNNSY